MVRRLGLALIAFAAAPAHAADPLDIEYFETEIRPILAARCYECHSADSGEPEGGLLVDRSTGWLAGGGRGPAIVAGDPEASPFIAAIRYDDPELQMPPDGPLPAKEIEALEAWIRRGAPAPADDAPTPTAAAFDLAARRAGHWCWQPIERVAPPEVEDAAWPRDAIDRFVLQRLERAGLDPASPAAPHAWLRRVTFDLTGLPPTRDEIAAFAADHSDAARAAVVDRLLASPAFGECWAQHWLDLVRYAETKGHEQDFDIPGAWRYRDYVIRAFNANVPFDQFVREHVAGDLVDPPRIDPDTRTNQSIQGTAFWHLGEATHSPVDIRGDEAERLANAIDVFGKTFLGLTIACARCHDHKFDAISKEDYYALAGFIESSGYQQANVADPGRQQELARQLEELNAAASRELIELYAKMFETRQAPWADELAAAAAGEQEASAALVAELEAARGDVAHPLHALAAFKEGAGLPVSTSAGGEPTPRTSLLDGVWLTNGQAFGDGPIRPGRVQLRADAAQPLVRVAEASAAASWRRSARLTGMIRTRTFEATAQRIWYRYRGVADVFAEIDSHRTVEGPLHGVAKQTLNSPDDVAWFCHDLRAYADHRIHIEFTPRGEFELLEACLADEEPTEPLRVNASVAAAFVRRQPADVTAAAGTVVTAFQAALFLERVVLAEGGAPLAAADAALINWLLAHDELLPPADAKAAAKFAAAASRYAAAREEIESQLPEPVWAVAMLDGDGYDERVHLRGNPRMRANVPTPRRLLAALDGEMTIAQDSGRDLLADRLVATDNPLTARVFVNRAWNRLLGRGIVATVDNFGVMGEAPTHPELLDFLAIEFVDSGWDVKRLIRRIVLSSTYGMSSVADPRAATVDPANHLFHAARVRRLPAEAVRDAMLAVSGQLNRERFGPSVPVHINEYMRNARSPQRQGPIDGDRRRSIYIEVRRNAMNHFLAAFDKPAPFTTVGHRYASNSAAQPLAMSNDPLVHAQAAAWAESLTSRFAEDVDAIEDAYLAAFGREPSDAEVERIVQHLGSSANREAAWREICLTLFNVKEFVFVP